MRNRPTVGFPNSAIQETQVDDPTISTSPESQVGVRSTSGIQESRAGVPSTSRSQKPVEEAVEIPPPKKKKTTTDDSIRKYLETSERRAQERDQFRAKMMETAQADGAYKNDALHHFFLSMCKSTAQLPVKYQREIKALIFAAVSKAEVEAEQEANVSSGCSALPVGHPEFVSPTNSSLEDGQEETITILFE